MSKDTYSSLEDAKGWLIDLQNARDKVTGGLSYTTGERESNIGDLMTETGRFMVCLDDVCRSVDDSLTEIQELRERVKELEDRVIELVEERDAWRGRQ